MASANLFQQYLQPVKSVADYSADMDRRDLLAMQLEGQQRQNAISGLDMQGKVSAMRDAQGDQQARRGVKFTTPEEYIQALRATNRPGLMAEADAREKAFLDAGKTRSDTAKSQAEVVAKALTAQGELATRVMATPTREAAAAALANMKAITQALGVPIDFRGDEAAVAALQTPEQIKQHFAGMALKASELLPKFQTVNAGNAHVQQAVDPLTGQARETGRTAILQSPDNAATVGAQIRGQNVTAETARLAREQSAQQHRQTLEQGGKAPAGYRWKADGTLEAIPGGPADTKLGGPGARVQDAKDVLEMLDLAEPLIAKSTGSYAGTGVDMAARAVGASTPGAQAAAELKALEGALISKMPKMSGPQSDKDVMLYRQMAGQIGDSTIPPETKKAAIRTIRQLNERYAGLAAKPAGGPQPGAVVDGYRFKGGNPADKANWEKQ